MPSSRPAAGARTRRLLFAVAVLVVATGNSRIAGDDSPASDNGARGRNKRRAHEENRPHRDRSRGQQGCDGRNRARAQGDASRDQWLSGRVAFQTGAALSFRADKMRNWKILRCRLRSSIPIRAAEIFWSNPSSRPICSRRFFRSRPSMAMSRCRARFDCRGAACANSNRSGASSITKATDGKRRWVSCRIRAGAESLVHRIRALETIRRSVNGNALSIRRVALLASVSAKPAQRRRAHYRPGHFPEPDAQRFFPIRGATASDTERCERGATE